MALTDFDEYVERLKENNEANFQMAGNQARTTLPNANWQQFQTTSPTAPTTSVALDKNSGQSISPIPAISTGRLTFLGAKITTTTLAGGCAILLDLLNVNGGLSGIVTTPQTTNLPTAALTRYTSGEGVMAGIVFYSPVGTTATTITLSYTNQAGTSGRTSPATTFGGSIYRQTGVLIPIPLQEGDTGVRSVESVTVTATTGAAGGFGVCLFKPLAMISFESSTGQSSFDSVSTGGVIGSLCEIHPDACLTISCTAGAITSMMGSIILTEA